MQPRTLFLAAILLLSTILVISNPAGATTGPTVYTTNFGNLNPQDQDTSQELIQQFSTTTGLSCSGNNNNIVTLTAGTSYVIVTSSYTGGTMTGTVNIQDQSSATIYSYTVSGGAGITTVNANWNPLELWSETSGGTTHGVQITVPNGATGIRYPCSASGANTITTPNSNAPSFIGCGTIVQATTTCEMAAYALGVQLQSESSIMSGCTSCPEATKIPTTSAFSWTRIGSFNKFLDSGTPSTFGAQASWASSGATGIYDIRESFSPDINNGRFLDSVRFQISGGNCNAGPTTLWASIGQTNNDTWDTTQELANLTGTIQTTTLTQGTQQTDVTIDFEAGTIASTASNVAAFTVTSKTPNPYFSPLFTSTLYLRIGIIKVNSCSGGNVGISRTNFDSYSGGNYYDCSTGTCTSSPNDFYRLSFFIHGGNNVVYALPGDARDIGGAYYTEICEEQVDTNPQKYVLTSSYDGKAIPTSFQAAGTNLCNGVPTTNQQTLQEWRLGYLNFPINATGSRTVTLDQTGSGRNQLWVGTFAGSQPTHTHIGLISYTLTGYNPLTTYMLYSTNDYFTQVFITVDICPNVVINSQCTADPPYSPLPNASYAATISGGRTLGGLTDANGMFNMTGSDLINANIKIILSKVGFATRTWTITTSTPGFYNFTLFLDEGLNPGGTISSVDIIITPNPGIFQTPAAANFTINVTGGGTYYWTIFQVNPLNGIPVVQTTTNVINIPSDSIVYPLRGYTIASGLNSDVGKYYIVASDINGNLFAESSFCIDTIANCAPPAVNSQANQTMTLVIKTQAPITQQQGETPQPSQAEQANDFILSAAIFMYAQWIPSIPNFVTLLLIGYGLWGMSLYVRAKYGGN